jgi:hypothetical protein
LSDEENEIGRRYSLPVFKRIYMPIVASVIFWILYRTLLKDEVCVILDRTYLLSLWPANLTQYQQIMHSSQTLNDKCFLLAMRSTLSAAFLIWLLWATVRQFFREDTVAPRLKGLLSIVVLFLLFFLHSLSPLSEQSNFRSLNVNGDVTSLMILLSPSIIFTYGLFVAFIDLIGRYMRSVTK